MSLCARNDSRPPLTAHYPKQRHPSEVAGQTHVLLRPLAADGFGRNPGLVFCFVRCAEWIFAPFGLSDLFSIG